MRSEGQSCFDTLRPACIAEFLCDGSVCDSNCCAKGWGIGIDEEYYALYQSISDEGIRLRVLDAIEQREDGAYAIKSLKTALARCWNPMDCVFCKKTWERHTYRRPVRFIRE